MTDSILHRALLGVAYTFLVVQVPRCDPCYNVSPGVKTDQLQTCSCKLGCLACSKHQLGLIWRTVSCPAWQALVASLMVLVFMKPPCARSESGGACHVQKTGRVPDIDYRVTAGNIAILATSAAGLALTC